ncbi:YqhG family protein [Pueribacillus sp. YX66]|uniref:YqhG family protein n=1 Tax=Pueribacillus sp. YX66 TaxID=3229242 RepID=UPI00358D3D44
MQQHDIHHYLERYFKANGCEITRNEDGLLAVKLTVELDKLLMNRPFYWHYIEKTGRVAEPMTLTFLTKKIENENGEFIHVGSPRLHQIFQAAKKTAAYIRLYEHVQGSETAYMPLVPWLMLNVKISYISDRKKNHLQSFGLQLITGQVCTNVIEQLEHLRLTPKLPDFSFPLTPLIKPKSGINRIKNQIYAQIENDDHEWAEEAKKRWANDLNLLERFYENKEKTEAYYNEKKALQTQYEPYVNIEVINGGILYLHNNRNLS